MPFDADRVQLAIQELITAIGEDPDRPGLAETAARVTETYREFFSGIGVDPAKYLTNTIPIDTESSELVLVRDVMFRSTCEHHLLPFGGVAHIAYVPRDRVVGLGSLPKVVNTLAARPQVQERLTDQIADAVSDGLDAVGVFVLIDAVHGCVTMRGPRQLRSSVVTVASRGTLTRPERRSEILTLIALNGSSDESVVSGVAANAHGLTDA